MFVMSDDPSTLDEENQYIHEHQHGLDKCDVTSNPLSELEVSARKIHKQLLEARAVVIVSYSTEDGVVKAHLDKILYEDVEGVFGFKVGDEIKEMASMGDGASKGEGAAVFLMGLTNATRSLSTNIHGGRVSQYGISVKEFVEIVGDFSSNR